MSVWNPYQKSEQLPQYTNSPYLYAPSPSTDADNSSASYLSDTNTSTDDITARSNPHSMHHHQHQYNHLHVPTTAQFTDYPYYGGQSADHHGNAVRSSSVNSTDLSTEIDSVSSANLSTSSCTSSPTYTTQRITPPVANHFAPSYYHYNTASNYGYYGDLATPHNAPNYTNYYYHQPTQMGYFPSNVIKNECSDYAAKAMKVSRDG